MKIYLYLISFVLYYYNGQTAQPYFPPQIVFSFGDDEIIMAIDEINQRAYITYPITPSLRLFAYVLKHFPYAPFDSPQSKYYVQLVNLSSPNSCAFGTYWKYGGDVSNSFPSHWTNGTSYEIKNYMNYNYEMIHSNESLENEDYWYANETCQIGTGEIYPCQEVYFKKDTDIPLRFIEIGRHEGRFIRAITDFTIISIGKPDDKYFNSISNDWFNICRDNDLGVLYHPQTVRIYLHDTVTVQVWLQTPPHRINGNDTVEIQWNVPSCTDCFTWTPKQFTFNDRNFQEKQTLKITRVKDSDITHFLPIFEGGGFDLVTPDTYPLIIE
jgi:hypothetical protein